MKVTIEPTGETAELPNGQRGAVWTGRTEDGVPIVAVMASVGCPPEHRATLERALPNTRRRDLRRCSWRDRLLGMPPMNCVSSAQEIASDDERELGADKYCVVRAPETFRRLSR